MKRLRAQREKEKGFTLLLAALVASIVLALGAAIYSIAIKQINLSSIGRDSQFAFYAADTYAECALYWDIRQSFFSTTTPPSQVTCNGITAHITAQSDSSESTTQSCSFWMSGGVQATNCPGGDASTFVVPEFTSMTVQAIGGGGGGGGGAACPLRAGNNGTDGAASSFGTLLTGAAGSRGGGAPSNCGSDGSNGGDGNGGVGGPNSSNDSPLNKGGNGGSGSTASGSYSPADLAIGTPVAITVGAGGNGGGGASASGRTGTAGGPGNSGQVLITWESNAATWSQTTFTFQFDSDYCDNITLIKRLSGDSLVSSIRSDGSNVPCAQLGNDPHALQRSVELNY